MGYGIEEPPVISQKTGDGQQQQDKDSCFDQLVENIEKGHKLFQSTIESSEWLGVRQAHVSRGTGYQTQTIVWRNLPTQDSDDGCFESILP